MGCVSGPCACFHSGSLANAAVVAAVAAVALVVAIVVAVAVVVVVSVAAVAAADAAVVAVVTVCCLLFAAVKSFLLFLPYFTRDFSFQTLKQCSKINQASKPHLHE